MAALSGALERASRKWRSLNIWASSESSCRCCSLACSGTRRTNSMLTGLPSGASNCTGVASRKKAPVASLRPLIRPWGMAMPWPRPVEPKRSRANRLSKTVLRWMPWLFRSEDAGGLLEALDPPVGDGDALAQAGGAQALPGEQAVENGAAVDALVVLEEQARLLEYPLLAARLKLGDDIGDRQESGDQIHAAGATGIRWSLEGGIRRPGCAWRARIVWVRAL